MHFLSPQLLVVLIFLLVASVIAISRLLVRRKRVVGPAYEAVSSLLTPAERSFFGVLHQAMASEYHIFAKVRLADIVRPVQNMSRSSWRSAFNRIIGKHVDFVLCDLAQLHVVAVIELDDHTHERPDRGIRDRFVDSALTEAHIPVLRISVERSYSPSQIRDQVKNLLCFSCDASLAKGMKGVNNIETIRSGKNIDTKSKECPIPPGTKRVIIFDTNAYREFTPGGSLAIARAKAIRLRECERAQSVLTLVNPTVVWELTAHLADSEDPAFTRCLNSVVVLHEHAANKDKPGSAVALFQDADSIVCRQLFQTVLTKNEQGIQNLGGLVKHIADNAPDLSHHGAQKNINHIASIVDSTEQEWLRSMQPVLARCDPNTAKEFFGDLGDAELREATRGFFASQTFAEMWAKSMVEMHAGKLGIGISSKDEMKDKMEIMLTVFPVTWHLLSSLLGKIAADKDFNLANPKKKRWNFIWDSQLTLAIGQSHKVAGIPVFFVTSDGEIIKAANAAGCGGRVLSLKDHLAAIGF